MPEFTNIAPGRLWQVKNLLTPDLVEQILETDWMSLPWSNSPQQKGWLRREISWDCPEAQRLSQYFDSQFDNINQVMGTDFTQNNVQFWIDLPGFTCGMHTDGDLPNSLQMYWIVPGPEYGTGFYHYKNKNSLLYQFESVCNTGYMILNHLNENGSQPLQWHGMFNAVPEGTIRVSSYQQFTYR
jgi:hypothetical protein